MAEHSPITHLGARAYKEFCDISDYIWKAPRLIEGETNLERAKLEAYFPLTGDDDQNKLIKKLRDSRWKHESHKLNGVFPYVMATGNLFSAIALFETYSLMLCKEIERKTSILVSEVNGSGINRHFKYLTQVGLNTRQIALWQQVDCAIKIRNCLFHASGLLSLMRNEAEMRQIVTRRA